MIVRELITKLGFQLDETKLNKFKKATSNIHKSVSGVNFSLLNFTKYLGGLVATTGAMEALATSTSNYVDGLSRLSKQTNVSIRDLSILEGIAQNSGVSVGEFTKSFSEFSNSIKLTGFSTFRTEAKLFKELGVVLKNVNGTYRDTFDIYTETVKKINAVTDSTKRNIYASTLLKTNNDKLITTFSKDRKELERYGKDFEKISYIISEEGVRSVEEYRISFNKLKGSLKSFSDELSIKAMPYLTKTNNLFTDWYRNNRNIISLGIDVFLKGLSTSLGILSSGLEKTGNLVNKMVDFFGGWSNTLQILGTILTLRTIPKILQLSGRLYAMSSAFVAAGGVVSTFATGGLALLGVAIGAVVNDMYHWYNENDSILGLILGSWDDFKNKLSDIIGSVSSNIKDTFSSVSKNFFGPIFDFINDSLEIYKKTSPVNRIRGMEKMGSQDNIKNPNNEYYYEGVRTKLDSIPNSSNNTNNNVNNKFDFTIKNINLGEGVTKDQAKELSKVFIDEFESNMNNEYIKAYGAFG